MKEPVNIISNSYLNPRGGPGKVLTNTVLGFEKTGQPYVFNQPIAKYRFNWIHDSVLGFIEVAIKKIPCIVGPNIFVTPNEIPKGLGDISHLLYLHPAQWPIDLWRKMGFQRCNLQPWPVGVDWESFQLEKKPQKNKVLLYFKKRLSIKLEKVIQIIKETGFEPIVIEYGKYNEEEYKKALQIAEFGVWVGTTESQGIGMQEAFASDLPLIVIENTNILDHNTNMLANMPKWLSGFKASSTPYWDKALGIVIHELSELPQALETMHAQHGTYKPLQYIRKELSLEKQANELLSYYEKFAVENLPNKKSTAYACVKSILWKNAYRLNHFSGRVNRKLKRIFIKH